MSQPPPCPFRCAKMLVERVKSQNAEVMIATHNQHSVETAVAQMHELDIDPTQTNIFFGQLLGEPVLNLAQNFPLQHLGLHHLLA